MNDFGPPDADLLDFYSVSLVHNRLNQRVEHKRQSFDRDVLTGNANHLSNAPSPLPPSPHPPLDQKRKKEKKKDNLLLLSLEARKGSY